MIALMHTFMRRLPEEIKKTISNPKRLMNVLDGNKLKFYLTTVFRAERDWTIDIDHGVQQKIYSSYEEYIAHQRSKLKKLDLTDYDRGFADVLEKRLRQNNRVRQGMNVLCLAARIGTEVKAFHKLGCFAVGIDLNPGLKNAYVLPGDFHDLQFPDTSIDIIFTNSLDHAHMIDRVIAEVRRLLKPGGLLIVEAVRGKNEGFEPGFYESFYWSNISDLLNIFEAKGFKCVSQTAFENPWSGVQISLEKVA